MNRPLKINFESSTSCNSNCVFCARSIMSRKRGQMSDELFHKIIKEGKDMGVRNYSPFFMGEPFVFPKIWEWLDYMEKEGVDAGMYTNGIYIDVERLAKYKNIRYLNFSINANTTETHKKVMRGPDFEIAKKNFKKAREICPFMVRASFVKIQDNIHELEAFKKEFGKTEICDFANWTGDLHDPLELKGEKEPCWVLLHQMFILWDGRVVPCCMDYNAKMVVGDANKQSLKEIWDKLGEKRQAHLDHKWGLTPACKACNYNVKRKP